MKEYYTLSEVSDLLSVSKETLRRWDRNGKLTAVREPMSNYRVYKKDHRITSYNVCYTKLLRHEVVNTR